MKILIIETVSTNNNQRKAFPTFLMTTFSILPTLQARHLYAITPKHHQTTLINERYHTIDYTQNYDIVNINCTTSTAPHAYKIADTFRKHNTTVVLSGWHPTGAPKEAAQHADSILVGTNELNWLHLLNDYEHHQLKPIYPPITPENNTHIPATNIQLPGFTITGAIQATRGCPHQCTFCPETHETHPSYYYMRPVDDVITELKTLPHKTIMFYDTSLTINPTYTKKLFKKMIPLNKKFFCNGNVNTLAHDTELVQLSQKAGCIAWLIGFETIKQTTLTAIKKKTNKATEYKKAITNIHNHHMLVIGCFIFGFDTDTPKIFTDTMHALKQLQIDAADFCILTPFPGTPLYRKLEKENRILTKNWAKYTMKNVVFQPKQLRPTQLTTGIQTLYNTFYNPLEIIKRLTRLAPYGFYPFFTAAARNLIAMTNKPPHTTQVTAEK